MRQKDFAEVAEEILQEAHNFLDEPEHVMRITDQNKDLDVANPSLSERIENAKLFLSQLIQDKPLIKALLKDIEFQDRMKSVIGKEGDFDSWDSDFDPDNQ